MEAWRVQFESTKRARHAADWRRQKLQNKTSTPPPFSHHISKYLCHSYSKLSIILLCAARTAQSITIFLQSITFKRDENTLRADTFFSNRYILTYLLFSTLVLNV